MPNRELFTSAFGGVFFLNHMRDIRTHKLDGVQSGLIQLFVLVHEPLVRQFLQLFYQPFLVNGIGCFAGLGYQFLCQAAAFNAIGMK